MDPKKCFLKCQWVQKVLKIQFFAVVFLPYFKACNILHVQKKANIENLDIEMLIFFLHIDIYVSSFDVFC